MKFSECIRMGSMLGPKITGGFTGLGGSSCAVGAAFLAIGEGGAIEVYSESPDWIKMASLTFPSLAMPFLPPREIPLGGDNNSFYTIYSVGEMIVHLNDLGRVTREQIADLIVANGWDCEAVFESAPAVAEAVEVCAAV